MGEKEKQSAAKKCELCLSTGHVCRVCKNKVCNFHSEEFGDNPMHRLCFKCKEGNISDKEDISDISQDSYQDREFRLDSSSSESDEDFDLEISDKEKEEISGKGKGIGKNSKSYKRHLSFSDEAKVKSDDNKLYSPARQAGDAAPLDLSTPEKKRLSSASTASPLARTAAGNRVIQQNLTPIKERVQDDDDPVTVYEGSLEGFWFVGNSSTRNWPIVGLKDFFIIVQDVCIMVFRVLPGIQIHTAQIWDALKQPLEEKVNLNQYSLYYKGKQLQEPGQSIFDLSVDQICLILAKSNLEFEHSGKLFTCSTCNDHPGFTRKKKFDDKHPDCQLFQSNLFKGKSSYGSGFDRKTMKKPYGCPKSHNGTDELIPSKSAKNSSSPISVVQSPAKRPRTGITREQLNEAIQDQQLGLSTPEKRPERSAKYKRQKDLQAEIDELIGSDSDSDNESNQNTQDKTSEKAKKRKDRPLECLYPTKEVLSNREERQKKMLEAKDIRLITEGFHPNNEDLQFEKKFRAHCFTKINKKWAKAEATLPQKELDLMRKGEIPETIEANKLKSSTYKSYIGGARQLLGVIKKSKGLEEIHYKDFFDFGEERFVTPSNIAEELLNQLHTGNARQHALSAYYIILDMQSSEAENNAIKFKKRVRHYQSLEETDPGFLRKKCEEEVETLQNRIVVIKDKLKPYTKIFKNQQKEMTEANRVSAEELEGRKVLDPSTVLPEYLNHESTAKVNNLLLKLANSKDDIPDRETFLDITNALLVRCTVTQGKRQEIFLNLTVREFLQSMKTGIKSYKLSQANESAEVDNKNVYDLGNCGKVVVEMTPVSPTSTATEREGVMIQVTGHKTGHLGPAIVFISTTTLLLMEAYYWVTKRFCKQHNIKYDTNSTLFINSNGNKVARIIYADFIKIAKCGTFKSHDARKIFATFMCNQGSVQLAEFAALAASHSIEVQQATYLGAQSKRIQSILADTVYMDKTTGKVNEIGKGIDTRITLGPEYDKDIATTLEEIERDDWQRQIRRQKMVDSRKTPSDKILVTPNVKISLLSLIVALGSKEPFSSRDIIGHYFGKKCQVKSSWSRSMILTLMDYAPELEDAKTLLENLHVFCSYEENSNLDVEGIEEKWATRLCDTIHNMKSVGKQERLSTRMLDILCPLNFENNYQYVFGNTSLLEHVRYVNKNRIFQSGVIKNLTNTGAALTIQEAIKMLGNKVVQTNQSVKPQEQVDDASEIDSMFDNIPEPEGNVAVARILGEPEKELIITTPGKVAYTIQATEDLMIHERTPTTPYSKMVKDMPVLSTPDKESIETTASGKHKPLTDQEKCQLLDLYIRKALDPLQVLRRNPMKIYCKEIFNHCYIDGGPIKGRMSSFELYAELLDKKGKGFDSEICKKMGLAKYITWGVKEFLPGVHDPTKEQLRSIREQIMNQVLLDARVDHPLWDDALVEKNQLE